MQRIPLASLALLPLLLPHVSVAAADDDDGLRARAREIRLQPEWDRPSLDDRRLQALLADLRSGDVAKQRDALEALARARPRPEHFDAVYALVKAVHARHDDHFSLAMTASINASWSEARTAAQVLASLNRRTAAKSLEAALANPRLGSLDVGKAMAALGYSGDRRAAEVLVRSFARNPTMAESALANIGPPAAPAIVPLLESPEWPHRRAAAQLLGRLGTAEQIPALEQRADDDNGLVRNTATEAIAGIREREKR